ncbi:uncharacterized protein LOC109708479 [Ananas comosus]|uniref:Uncharacterized protein LOC109708479 n=2 Tax=Ananas comosus TaxID=4615 RepID=A0A6P5EX92_ANACO|nr:uncharacterized protein LOC109708479 [Ananas comosus]CAD1828479.1 unnamed protein product [Ananas comosus var. bracteatus]
MDEGQGAAAPPHGVLLAAVVAAVAAGPFLLGDWEAVTEWIAELLSPAGLLLLPVTLILLIRFLSSDRAAALSDLLSFSGAGAAAPDSAPRVGGSPFGVALVLALILFLLYHRISLFGGGGDDGED